MHHNHDDAKLIVSGSVGQYIESWFSENFSDTNVPSCHLHDYQCIPTL